MSTPLNKRLDKLETEIRYLLSLQKKDDPDVNFLQSVTASINGEVYDITTTATPRSSSLPRTNSSSQDINPNRNIKRSRSSCSRIDSSDKNKASSTETRLTLKSLRRPKTSCGACYRSQTTQIDECPSRCKKITKRTQFAPINEQEINKRKGKKFDFDDCISECSQNFRTKISECLEECNDQYIKNVKRCGQSQDQYDCEEEDNTSLMPEDASEINLSKNCLCLEFRKCKDHEITKLKSLVKELKNSNDLALTLSQQWKEKYLSIRDGKCSQTKKLQSALHEKEVLLQHLQEEQDRLKESKEKVKKCEQQLYCQNLIQEKYEKLLDCIAEKNEQIQSLECKLCESEQSNTQLEARCEEMQGDMCIMNEKLVRLRNTNQELATDIINKCKCLEAANVLAQNEITKYKSDLETSHQEVCRLMEVCACNDEQIKRDVHKNKNLEDEVACLCKQLNDAKEKEESASETMTVLETKIQELQCQHEGNKRSCQEKIQDLLLQNRTLQSQYTEMLNKLEEQEIYGLEKCKCIEAEFRSFKNNMNGKEHELINERNELKGLVDELSEIIESQKARINDLMAMTCQSKNASEMQEKRIAAKEEELKRAVNSCNVLRTQCGELEKHVKSLRETDDFNKKPAGCGTVCRASLENEINALRNLVEELKSKLNIKDKMLDDQMNTITQLKQKIAEKDNNVAALYKDLSDRRKEVGDLNNRVTQLQQEKGGILCEYIKSKEDLDHQNSLIETIEKTMCMQKEEFQLQHELDRQEKEKALHAAKFATQKLSETMEDFQQQCTSQCHVRNVLTSMLQEKDDKLKSAMQQLSLLTRDSQAVLQTLASCAVSKLSSVSTGSFCSAKSISTDNLPEESPIECKAAQQVFVTPSNTKVKSPNSSSSKIKKPVAQIYASPYEVLKQQPSPSTFKPVTIHKPPKSPKETKSKKAKSLKKIPSITDHEIPPHTSSQSTVKSVNRFASRRNYHRSNIIEPDDDDDEIEAVYDIHGPNSKSTLISDRDDRNRNVQFNNCGCNRVGCKCTQNYGRNNAKCVCKNTICFCNKHNR